MKSGDRKKYWYIFLILFGVFGLTLHTYSFVLAHQQDDNFKILSGGFWMIAFTVFIIRYIMRYRELVKSAGEL